MQKEDWKATALFLAVLAAGAVIFAQTRTQDQARKARQAAETASQVREAWAGKTEMQTKIDKLESQNRYFRLRIQKYQTENHGPAKFWDDPLPPDREVTE